MFKHAKSRVKRNGRLGYIFENLSSVLQGGVLSSTLIFTSLPLSYPSYADCVNMGASGAESSKRDWDPWRWTMLLLLRPKHSITGCHNSIFMSCKLSLVDNFIPIFSRSNATRDSIVSHSQITGNSVVKLLCTVYVRKFPRVTCDLFTTTEWHARPPLTESRLTCKELTTERESSSDLVTHDQKFHDQE